MYLTGSSFTNGFSYEGGAIYTLGKSNLTIFDCDFTNNIAQSFAGVIYAVSFSNLKIEKSRFKDKNVQENDGDVLYALNGDLIEIKSSLLSSK